MKAALAFVAALAASEARAQSVEELRAALEAERQINALLKQRIETLEAKFAGNEIAPPPRPVLVVPDAPASDSESDGALERALVRAGTAVLPPFKAEVSPSLVWRRSGSDALSSTDSTFQAAADARLGLPDGWMVGAQLPVIYRDADGVGDNTGVGDASATVWKSLIEQDGVRPSLVAGLRYSAPTGDDFSEDVVPLGSGFHQFSGQLSTVRTIDPIAFFGDVSYTHFLAETISGVDVERSGQLGFGVGATLAVTPDISLTAALDFAFEGDIERDGIEIDGTSRTFGQVEIGAGFVLTRDVFLTVGAGFGITDDSPDVTLGASLPVRF